MGPGARQVVTVLGILAFTGSLGGLTEGARALGTRVCVVGPSCEEACHAKGRELVDVDHRVGTAYLLKRRAAKSP